MSTVVEHMAPPEDTRPLADDDGTRARLPVRVGRSLWRGLRIAWRWFAAWRRTRPFWGGLWTILAGAEIIKFMSFNIGLALTGGWSYSAGYVMGGALVLFGLVAWFAPQFKSLAGIVAFLVALGAFPTANLGGFLLGSVLGIIGSSMMWSWGPKKPFEATALGKWKAARKTRGDVGRRARRG
jgi:hypothetical protein